MNTSDHFPVMASIRSSSGVPSLPITPMAHPCFRPNWHKCNPHQLLRYKSAVSHALPPLPTVWNTASVDSFVKDISEVLVSAASDTLPSVQFHKYIRPAWGPTLKRSHSKCKQAYREWCRHGRSSSPSDPFRIAYKLAKRGFRQSLRSHKCQEFDTFLNSLDLDQRKLFHQLRLRNGSVSPPTNILHFNSRLFDGSSILEGWAHYFEGLATPSPDQFPPKIGAKWNWRFFRFSPVGPLVLVLWRLLLSRLLQLFNQLF